MQWISLLALCLTTASPGHAYSVLTHEAIIDTAWTQNIVPVLRKKFPNATADDLKAAHSYAYAGCIIQDMGYYPFGNKFFSDLVHYTRSGDFVVNLIREAQDLNEYAFALGALAHYAADTEGHGIAVNRAVPLDYPKLERKFGTVVTYGEDPAAHLKVEFGFDVLQVARGDYAPQAYHDFIGFHVAKEVLERAFRDTYSLDLSDVFSDLDLALGTYRHLVSSTIPKMTRVAWRLKKNELIQARPGLTRRTFLYNLSKASYRKEWDDEFHKPGAGSAVLAFFIRILPKIGPLRGLEFKAPDNQTEALFERSFDATLTQYRQFLAEARGGRLTLVNRDLDTGRPTRPDEYELADRTYAELAVRLAQKPPETIDPALRRNVLAYYGNEESLESVKKNRKRWLKTLAAVQKLQGEAAFPANREGGGPINRLP